MNILGLDIGGTAVKMGILDSDGQFLFKAEHSVSFDGYQTPILDTALYCARQFVQQCGVEIAGIGISATGQIDVESGTVVGTCGNLPGWVGVSLKNVFEDAFHVPVVAMNDANAAILGESWMGAARGCQDVVMVTLGTGVGGGVLVNGQVLEGRMGLAGELGHMPLKHHGRLCTCGNRGCYEQYASATALLSLAEERLALRPANAKALFDLAEGGDEAVAQLLGEWRDAIAAGLVGLTHLFSPELILLGGGVSRQEEWLVAPVRDAVLRLAMPRFVQGLRIEAAKLGNEAGMMGAAYCWMNQYDHSLQR